MTHALTRAGVAVRLSRGNGKGQWAARPSSDTGPTLVFFRCPSCSGIGVITSPVTADGLVTTQVSCSLGQCTFSHQVYLDGWAEMNRQAGNTEVIGGAQC